MTESTNSTKEALALKLKELKTRVEDEDFGAAIRLCEEVLGLEEIASSASSLVLEIYVKALLHEKQYEKVLSLSSSPEWIQAHQAYACYRLEQYDRAIQLAAASSNTDDPTAAHIHAQALYHLNDTEKAMESYQKLTQAHAGEEEGDEFWTEVYTNMMAVLTANATPYNAWSSSATSRDKAHQLLLEHADPAEDFPCDLAYNVASYDLLSADTKASRQKALTLLNQAQKACKQALAHDDESTLQQELQPIQINLLWGKTFWGEDAPGSTTTFQAANTKQLHSLLQHQVNPALLQESSPNKVIEKTILTLQLLLQGITTNKLTPTQKRLCRYNLAVMQLRMGQYEPCQQTLEVLGQSLIRNKKKSKTTTTTAVMIPPPPTDADTLWWQARVDVLLAHCLFRKKQLDPDDQKGTTDKLEKQFQDALSKLQSRLETAQQAKLDESTQKLRDHTIFYLQLHLQHFKQQQPSSSDSSFSWLQSLANHKAYPAITASLAKAYQDRNQPEKAKELLFQGTTTNNNNGNQILAEMAMAKENYSEAVTLYNQVLEKDPDNHTARARLVEALSHVDPKQAIVEWNKMDCKENDDDDDDSDEGEDGEALELRELPRIKHGSGVDPLAATAQTGASSTMASNALLQNNQKKKKSREAILRQRAKHRQVHLDKLQEKGLYNPERPTQPDPERWIPKQERQRRRRRGGQNSNTKSSQGGISAKEAAKLDVAARAAGVEAGTSGPSTAHLTVAGGSRKGGGRRR